MSYKETPQLKLYKYENSAFILQAIIDDFQECSFEDNLYAAGQFSITINFNIPNSQLFQRGLFIQFGNSWKFGEITKIQDKIDENGKGSQYRIITGYDARYILKRRVIKNMNSNGLWIMTGKGEIVLRNLINDQCGTNAEEKRKLPIINTIPDSETAIGKEYSASEQFSNLYEVCKTIATQSEIGWRLEFNGTSLTLVCFEGTDRTQTVQFSTSFDSLANGEFIDSSESFSNAIYVGGKGQNDDRDIYEGESAIEGNSPAGLDRFESWDNQSSMTTESEYETEALSMLNQYGQTLTMSGNGLAKCPYEYEKEYFVGDKIKIAFSGKSANAQILSVTEHWAFGTYEINFNFGKPLPDLNAQLQLMLKQIQKASNKTNSKDSVRWYDIPTDTEMPASDVTYNTIGFIGNVGSGATFTLYRDSSGTGSKTYHVYFKQLDGSGKLTLTTGVSGASNLVMNPGTYVAIIYVDENGNITSQGMTATDIIQSGSTQPIESGAVADEIENLTEIASSLPTDAVLHYSFDEVPDYPDGTAIEKHIKDFTSVPSSWSSNNRGVLSVANGELINTISGTNPWIRRNFSTSTSGIVKVKVRATVDCLIALQYFATNYISLVTISDAKANQEYTLTAFMPSTSFLLVQAVSSVSTDFQLIISDIYIGDGSYSTPIIDNANGQNNATNNGGIAVQGVSGKGLYFLEGAKKTVTTKTNNILNGNKWTVSLWITLNEGTEATGKNPRIYNFGNIEYAFISNLYKGFSGENRYIRFYTYQSDNHWVRIDLPIETLIGQTIFIAISTELNINGISTKTVYLNGQRISSVTSDTLTERPSKYITGYIGSADKTSATFLENSMLDDFQIFNRALSDTEVQALYQNKANTPKYYDLSDYKMPSKQNTELSAPITIAGQSYTTVESALQALAGAI